MTAAHQIWTDDPRNYGGGGNYESPARVLYIGTTLPSPELLASVLGDPEDNFATTPPRLRTVMPNDDDQEDPRAVPTLAPDTEPTRTENPVPERRDAIAPGAIPTLKPATADSMFTDAVNQIVEAANVIKAGKAEADRLEQRRREEHEALLAAIQKADDNNQRSYEMLRDELRHLKDSDLRQDQRLIEGEKRFATIEQSISELKVELLAMVAKAATEAAQKIEKLELALADLKARNAPAPSPSPPAPAEQT